MQLLFWTSFYCFFLCVHECVHVCAQEDISWCGSAVNPLFSVHPVFLRWRFSYFHLIRIQCSRFHYNTLYLICCLFCVLLRNWVLFDGYDFYLILKTEHYILYSSILHGSIFCFPRLLFMDVAAGPKILELITPTLQLWVPQVFAAFMAIFHSYNPVSHLVIKISILGETFMRGLMHENHH